MLWHVIADGYVLVLTLTTAMLVLGMRWRNPQWRCSKCRLRSLGTLSYEIYLVHMFVVFAVVRAFRATGEYPLVWYVLAFGGSWLLGAAVARWFSQPCERGL